MSAPPLLTPAERAASLAALSAWRESPDDTSITRSFKFKDFDAAFAFMTRVAEAARAADHHPDWSNSWNRVDIGLTTHASGGITERDVGLARAIDAIFAAAG